MTEPTREEIERAKLGVLTLLKSGKANGPATELVSKSHLVRELRCPQLTLHDPQDKKQPKKYINEFRSGEKAILAALDELKDSPLLKAEPQSQGMHYHITQQGLDFLSEQALPQEVVLRGKRYPLSSPHTPGRS